MTDPALEQLKAIFGPDLVARWEENGRRYLEAVWTEEDDERLLDAFDDACLAKVLRENPR
uniref:Uncharacterized protein n=1 Tax=viral metagenome TaxID=1070528 RepID=A0A6M3KLH7_9ZZZZ